MEQSLVTKKAVKQLLQIDSSFASAKKEDALGVYRSLPMPKEKDEDWRYTHIGNLKIENFENENSEVNIKIEADFEELKSKGVILSDINSALDKYPAAQNYFFRSSKTDKDKFVAMCASQFTNGI